MAIEQRRVDGQPIVSDAELTTGSLELTWHCSEDPEKAQFSQAGPLTTVTETVARRPICDLRNASQTKPIRFSTVDIQIKEIRNEATSQWRKATYDDAHLCWVSDRG